MNEIVPYKIYMMLTIIFFALRSEGMQEGNPQVPDCYGRTLLHWAIRRDKIDTVRSLLDQGAKLHAQDKDGITPLHWAAETGHVKSVCLLIEKGAFIDQADSIGNTPLHYTAMCGCQLAYKLLSEQQRSYNDIIHILIHNKATLNAKNIHGKTPLYLAVDWNHQKIVQQLLEYGAEVNTQDNTHSTPLHNAVEYGYSEITRLLIKHGAYIDKQNNKGETPLHKAIFWVSHNWPLAERLLKILLLEVFFDTSWCLQKDNLIQASKDQVVCVALLKTLCFNHLLKNVDLYTKSEFVLNIVPTIMRYLPQKMIIIADKLSLEIQRALICAWQESNDQNLINIKNEFIATHCHRHLSYIQYILTLKDKAEKTLSERAYEVTNKSITLLEHIMQARKFENLNEDLQKMIEENIKSRFTLPKREDDE